MTAIFSQSLSTNPAKAARSKIPSGVHGTSSLESLWQASYAFAMKLTKEMMLLFWLFVFLLVKNDGNCLFFANILDDAECGQRSMCVSPIFCHMRGRTSFTGPRSLHQAIGRQKLWGLASHSSAGSGCKAGLRHETLYTQRPLKGLKLPQKELGSLEFGL